MQLSVDPVKCVTHSYSPKAGYGSYDAGCHQDREASRNTLVTDRRFEIKARKTNGVVS